MEMNYSPEFEEAINYVLPNEGGYVNDPLDSGGETNFGISKRFLNGLQNEALTKKPLKEWTKEDAKSIYFKYFWAPFPFEKIIHSMLRIEMFDFSINAGMAQAVKILQRAYNNRICVLPFLKVDGVMGATTLACINQCAEKAIHDAFEEECIRFYINLVKQKPANKRFLKGWIRRAEENPDV